MYAERYWNARELEAVDEVGRLAAERGVAPATLAIAWVLAHPAITAPLVGASKPEQLAASVAAVDLVLEPALKTRLDELSHDFRMGDAVR
jgi:aryl-alcohol dehydrogenase-like predicted oxidoreductase